MIIETFPIGVVIEGFCFQGSCALGRSGNACFKCQQTQKTQMEMNLHEIVDDSYTEKVTVTGARNVGEELPKPRRLMSQKLGSIEFSRRNGLADLLICCFA